MDSNFEKTEKTEGIQLKEAVDNISVIRQIFDRILVNTRSLATLFIVMGAAFLAEKFVFSAIGIIFRNQISIDNAANIFTSQQIVSYALLIVLFIWFLIKRFKMKKTENSTTMKLYDVWGVVMFGFLPLNIIIRLIMMLAGSGMYEVLLSNTALSIMQLASVCVCVYFTGLLSNKLYLKVIAAVMFIGFALLLGLNIPFIDGSKMMTETETITSLYGYISLRTELASIFTGIIYLVMGICFAVKNGRKNEA